MKRETEKAVILHFKDYRENFKFQYLIKLAGAVSASLDDLMVKRFESHITDLANIAGQIKGKRLDREHASVIMNDMGHALKDIDEKINGIRRKMAGVEGIS